MIRALTILGLGLFLVGCRLAERSSHLQRFEYEQPQMGVPFRIVLYATDEEYAEAAVKAAFRRIEQLNAIMSDYETDSELSLLSRSSEQGAPPVPLSDDLWNVLEASQQLAELSGGAFDITVGPCVALWRKARREQEMPEERRLATARGKVGFQNLVLSPESRTARLLQPGMRLDLGGIAKGYAADEALRVLHTFGIRRALIAASGDLVLGDPPPGAKGWRVELAGSDASGGTPAAIVHLANRAVATSGDLYQRVEINGLRYSHIVDPFTCLGMTNHALATVIARDGMTADSIATTATIASRAAALQLAERYQAGLRVTRLEEQRLELFENARFARIPKTLNASTNSARPDRKTN
jgi:thiamine biosynthesis lipoprotein